MAKLIVLLLLGIACVVGYAAYPQSTVARLQTAFASRDVDTIDRHVNWPRLRESVKAEARAAMLDASKALQGGSLLAGLFGGKLVDTMVDGYITSAALRRIYEKPVSEDAKFPSIVSSEFVTPTLYRVTMKAPDGSGARFTADMEFESLMWRVVDVHIAADQLQLIADQTSPALVDALKLNDR